MELIIRGSKSLDIGGDIIKRNALLALVLIMCMIASNVGGAFAESLTNQTSNNLTDSSSTQSLTGNTTTGVSNTTVKGNTTNTESNSGISNGSSLNESSIGFTADSIDSNLESENPTTESSSNSTSNTSDNSTCNSTIKGVWVQTGDALGLNVTQLLGMGITDVYVKCNIYSDPTYKAILSQVVSMFNGTGIRVDAWVTCFKDANGSWVNPIGTAYNYTVQVPYEGWYQTWQQVWYKAWYKYNGHWTWKWAYFMKYNWVWGDTTFNQTVTGYNTTHNDEVISAISDMVKNYGVNGVNLDYCRYPGTAYEYTNGTEAITNFVKQVYNTVKSINSDATVSVDTMPEESVNAYYYGQNYTQLAQYTDYLVVMAYKGNYNENTSWIGKVTSYIINQTNGKPVIVGLQTYESDSNVTPLSASELQGDINESLNNGASGYALFRYGLINQNYTGTNTTNSSNSTITNSSTTTSDNSTTTNTTTTDNSTNTTTNGTLTNNTTISYTISEIEDAATRVANYVEANYRLPNYVTIGTEQVSMPNFLKLLVDTLLNIYNNNTSSVTLSNYSSAPNPFENITAGNIQESEYINMAQRISSFMESNGAAPNYASSSLGNMEYQSLIYMYSKILRYEEANNRLPNYNSVKTWTNVTTNSSSSGSSSSGSSSSGSSSSGSSSSTVASWLEPYLQSTANCQVTDSRIVADVAAITSGITDPYAKALALYNWLHTHENYQFYSNSVKGAVGTLCSGYGNCCDLSNLMVAFARAAGIPARYVHGYCHFSSAWYGHVWAQLYVNGQWINADLSSSRNSFGVINNWNTATATIYGYYQELPF